MPRKLDVRKWTDSEMMVGRRLPPLPSYKDTLMAGFVKERDCLDAGEDVFCGRMDPMETYLKPAWKQMRRAGWVRYTGFLGIWFLTDRGQVEAIAAYDRCKLANKKRDQWGSDCRKAWEPGKRKK